MKGKICRSKISVVVPVFNEEVTIAPLLNEIAAIMSQFHKNSEIIVVDDGSADRTAEVLEQSQNDHPDLLRSVRFAENRGQGAALFAGLKTASGDYVVTLDGDGQNDPLTFLNCSKSWEMMILS